MGTAIAIIPARGGSKRIPGKNLKLLAGKPAIGYTILAAIESGLFQRIVVTTDSKEIAEVALKFGAEVPFLRGAHLADDVTPVSEATADALCQLASSGLRFDHVGQLMANCPLRNAADLADSYRQFQVTEADSQISVVRYGWQNPWWAMRRNDEYRLESLFDEARAARSQDLPELFCPTGAIWWARSEVVAREKTFYTENVKGWEIPWERGIDIDTADDWAMAEVLLELSRREHSSK
jgi:CMP-N-acetylneuraminic acid synthetase